MHDAAALSNGGAQPPGNLEAIAPASHAQQRLWFFDQLQPGSAIYNVEHMQPLSDRFDHAALQAALDDILRRQEALRTTFRNVDGIPFQVVHPPRSLPFARRDLTGLPPDSRAREVQRIFDEEIGRGFDLAHGPLLRVTVMEIDARQQMLLLVAHHIVFDMWSSSVFGRELTALYENFRQGRPASIPEPAVRYSAFAAEQRLRFDARQRDPQTTYWLNRLADLPAATEMPLDRPRPAVQTYAGAIKTFYIAPEIALPFRSLTRGADATLFMSLFAAYAILLHRYSGQDDLAVGTPIANRSRPELDGVIGFLLNTLVLRIQLDDDPTVSELLARSRSIAIEAFANQDVPFEFLIEELKPRRDPSRSPLFQTMFVFQPTHGDTDGAEENHVTTNGAKFDLTLTVKDAGAAMWGALEYNTDLYEPETIDRLADHFRSILTSMAASPMQRVSDVTILSPEERQRILFDWNRTRSLPPTTDCLPDLFERAASADPHAVAVSSEAGTLTYGDLARRVTTLAARLRSMGVGAEVRVGICMERSFDWIVAIFATLRAGGAMVPLDSAFPPARLAFMIEDASVALVLTQSRLADRLEDSVPRICLDRPLPDIAPHSSIDARDVRSRDAGPRDIAYVVYTSGSTGNPKGVVVQHDGAVNFMRAQIEDWGFGPGARVLQFTAFGFDIGLSEIFLTLCSGAQFCLAPAADLRAGPPLLKTLRDLRITHVTLPPSALAAMQPETLPDLRLIISAGEACTADLAHRWAPGRRIVNAYGPTEATIYAAIGEIDTKTGAFPVGRPIPNVQVYVLDRHGEPVPPGVTGEIHFGGIGVARGYLNRPELTAEKFIPDPFAGRAGGRLYRTGDLGRFDAAGVLHYRGRVDVQLKIRGYRIEPGEVESVLRRHSNISDALVVSHGTGADARLVAFYIPDGAAPLVIELRSFLGRFLPDYMTPAAYIAVEAWPKTANGKIDRAALPRPDAFAREVDGRFVAPAGTLEEKVAAIWRDCLGVAEVGTSDNFFDLGGHSLLLVKVHDQLKDKLGFDLSLMDLFRYPTIKLQATMLVAKLSSQPEVETLGQTDQRAARQNAARQQRRQRTQGQRDQGPRDRGQPNA